MIKPGKLFKLVGKGLGDTAIDILGAGAPTTQAAGQVVIGYCVLNDGEGVRRLAAEPRDASGFPQAFHAPE